MRRSQHYLGLLFVSCDDDDLVVVIYNGTPRPFAKYCGSKLPPVTMSTDSMADVFFFSRPSAASATPYLYHDSVGFRAEFAFVSGRHVAANVSWLGGSAVSVKRPWVRRPCAPVAQCGVTVWTANNCDTRHVADQRESAFLVHRLSVPIQRFNAVAVRGTFVHSHPLKTTSKCSSLAFISFHSSFNPQDLHYRG